MSNLKQKTLNSMAWSITERVSLQVIHIGISIVLARLLEPSEFGLIGMLAIFTSIAQSILDSGFGSALIQKKDATEVDSSSIFYFNLLIGILLAGVFFLSAPLIANFYNQPILKPLTRVLSLNMIIGAFSLVQLSMLRKKLQFKNHFIVSMIAVFISGGCSILAALNGLGVWSLVIQALSHGLAQAGALWLLSRWKPVGRFSLSSLKTMYSFGSKLLIAGLIETIFKNLYQTFIGRVFTPSDVGYYSRASQMESAASVATSMALGTVVFSAFSPYQDDKDTLRKVHSKTIKMSMFLIMPLMIGLIVIAEPLFIFLLTDKWADSIPYFQLLCIIGLHFPVIVQNYNLLRITGRTGLHLKLEIFKYVMTIIAIAVTFRHGILALIYGQIAVTVISHFVVSYFVGRLINYTIFDQLKALFPIAIGTTIMGLSIFFIGKINFPGNLVKFSTQIIIGIIVYFLINKLIKSPELGEFIQIIQGFIKSILLKIRGLHGKTTGND
jgi:O-antigen/teichoic acid export membrane protein